MAATLEFASDSTLIDATLAALRDERRRAPSDLLAILTVLLVVAAGSTLALGIALGDGVPRDFFINLTTEILGAALTAVLIGGLWYRLQASSEGALEGLVARTAERRGEPLSDAERTAFAAIVDLHEQTARRGPLARMVLGFMYAIRNRRRLQVVEEMLRIGPR
jgi:hypothetical protein